MTKVCSTQCGQVKRSIDVGHAKVGKTVTVTVTFTNHYQAPLCGFYYAEHITCDLTVTPISTSIDSRPSTNCSIETEKLNAVHPNTVTWRWILEAPLAPDSTFRIIYAVRAVKAGCYALREFNWACKGLFGYSAPGDAIILTVYGKRISKNSFWSR